MPRGTRLLFSFPALMIGTLGFGWMLPSTAVAQDVPFAPTEVTSPLVALVSYETFGLGVVPPVGLVLPIPESRIGQEPLRRPAALIPLYVSFATLQGLDVHSTMKAAGAGGSEANPAMRGLVRQPAAFVAAKVAASAATFYVSERLWRRHRVAAVVLMLAVNGAYAAIVANNYRR